MTDPDGNPKWLTKVQCAQGMGGEGGETAVVQCSLTTPPPQINYRGEVPRSYYLRNQVRTHTVREHGDCGLRLLPARGDPDPVPGLHAQVRMIATPLVGTAGRGLEPREVVVSGARSPASGSSPKTRQGEQQLAGEMTEVLPAGAHMVPKDRGLTCLKAGVRKRWQKTAPPGAPPRQLLRSTSRSRQAGGGLWLR